MNPIPFQAVFHKYIASFSGYSLKSSWGSLRNGEAAGHQQSQPVVQFPLHLFGEGSAWRTWIKWWWLSQLKCGSAPWSKKTARLRAYLWDSWKFASRARLVGVITPSRFSVTRLCPSPKRICWGKVSLREFQRFHQGRKPRGRTSSDRCRGNMTYQKVDSTNIPRGDVTVTEISWN